jgi:beta-mannosidase
MTVRPGCESDHSAGRAEKLMAVPIYLDTYDYRFEDVRIDTALAGDDLKRATLKASFSVSPTHAAKDLSVNARLVDRAGKVVRKETGCTGDIDWALKEGEVDAWWPIGYGEQPLYKLELELVDKVSLVDANCRADK